MARQAGKKASETGASSAAWKPEAAKAWLPAAAAVLLCTALLGWLQFSFAGLADSDSYFHTRAARDLGENGFRRTFPQAAFSTWSERYSDKDLLFHAVLAPFQLLGSKDASGREDLVTPGKRAIVLLTFLLFAALAFALHCAGARHAWFWVLLFFSTDLALLRRLLQVRPGILGATLLLLGIALLLRGRPFALAIAGGLHAYAHSSFVLLPAMALALVTARAIRREPFGLKILGFALLGPAVALVIHPYFPNNLFVAWDQIVEVARGTWLHASEVPLDLFGPELGPMSTRGFLSSFAGFLPAAAGILVFLAYPSLRISTPGLGLVLMSGTLATATFLSERFMQFFLPVAVLAGARLWSEILGDRTLREAWLRDARATALGAGLLGGSLLAGLSHGTVFGLSEEVRNMGTADLQRPAIEFLDRVAAPEDLVYHNFWWDFSALYHFRPRGRYVVALDPVFFYRHDPVRFRKSLEAYRGEGENLYRTLKSDFGARWVYLPKGPQHIPFYGRMRQDPGFELAYEDDFVVIARLR